MDSNKAIITTVGKVYNAIWTEMVIDKDGDLMLLEKDIAQIIRKLVGGTNADRANYR